MDRMEVSGTSDKGSIPFGCTLKLYLQRVRLFIIVFSAHVWYMMLQRRAFFFEYFYSVLFSHDLLCFDSFPCSTRIVAYANVQLSHDIKAVIDKILCSILLSVVA